MQNSVSVRSAKEPSIDNSRKQLSEREQIFLEVLFGEAQGDIKEAKKIAGYPPQYPISHITSRLKEEIVEATYDYLAAHGPHAVATLVNILIGEPVPDAKNKITAAKEILDRGGIIKKEHKTVTVDQRIAYLPEKNS